MTIAEDIGRVTEDDLLASMEPVGETPGGWDQPGWWDDTGGNAPLFPEQQSNWDRPTTVEGWNEWLVTVTKGINDMSDMTPAQKQKAIDYQKDAAARFIAEIKAKESITDVPDPGASPVADSPTNTGQVTEGEPFWDRLLEEIFNNNTGDTVQPGNINTGTPGYNPVEGGQVAETGTGTEEQGFPWAEAISAGAGLYDSMNRSGGVSGTATYTPPPRTPEQSRANQATQDMLWGNDQWSENMWDRFLQDEAHRKAADEAMLKLIEDAMTQGQGRNEAAFSEYRGGVDPMVARNQDVIAYNDEMRAANDTRRAANDRAMSMNAPLANRAPVNLSIGGFNTPFTTGSQRNAQRYGLDLGQHGIDLGNQNIRFNDQSMGTQNQSAMFLESIMSGEQGLSDQQRQDAINQAELQNQIANIHTPNVANREWWNLISGERDKDEDRRYQIPTQHQTVDAGRLSVTDTIDRMAKGAASGSEILEIFDEWRKKASQVEQHT